MSCVLRIYTEHITDFLNETDIATIAVFKKGEVIRSNKIIEQSGCNIDVSSAGFNELLKQIEDTINFLRFNYRKLHTLEKFDDVNMELDFGLEIRLGENVAVHRDYFPFELLKLAGNLKINLCLSYYWPCE